MALPAEGSAFCEGAAGAKRHACLTRWVAAHPPSTDSLRLLTEHLESDPALVADAVELYGFTGEGQPDPALAAALLDLRATALAGSGDTEGAAATMALAVHNDDGTRRLVWVRPGGAIAWSTPVDSGDGRLLVAARRMLEAGRGPEARPLLAEAVALGSPEAIELWRRTYSGEAPAVAWPGEPLRQVAWGPPVPDLIVPLYDGESFPLHGEGVLLLDFWASWCYPCQKELPALEALWEAQKDAGLRAVAINVHETADVAVPAAKDLGLTLPLGEYTPNLANAFRVDELPTLIVADSHGKVRRRWNGYRNGIEEDVAETVRGLLHEAGATEIVELASVLRDDLPLEVSWVRKGPRPVQAVAVVPASDVEQGAIVVASRDDLVLLESDGAGRAQYPVPFDANQLRRLPGTEGARVAAFRRGGTQVYFLRPKDGDSRAESTPSAVFDLRAAPSQGEKSMLVATLEGPVVWDGDESHVLDAPDRALALVDTADEGAPWAVLDGGRSIVWLDSALAPEAHSAPVPAASQLVAARGEVGVGVLSGGLLGAAAGRAGAARWIAVAAPDQLVLLDAGSGHELFRARWEGLAAVASGDVDGDGRDELAVGSGNQVSLLRISEDAVGAGEASEPR